MALFVVFLLRKKIILNKSQHSAAIHCNLTNHSNFKCWRTKKPLSNVDTFNNFFSTNYVTLHNGFTILLTFFYKKHCCSFRICRSNCNSFWCQRAERMAQTMAFENLLNKLEKSSSKYCINTVH